MKKPLWKIALVFMVMISLGYSFSFGTESFGPKQTKYVQNFESGLGNWTNSSLWIKGDTTPLNGTYSMFFQGTGTGNTRLFAANQTGGTSGWQGIQIIAQVKTNALDAGENLTLSVYDGTTWYTIWSQEDVTQQVDTWNLNTTFDNNANFAVNFTCVSNGGANERCWVDDFAIRGTPLGGLRITNLSISPVNGSSVAMDQYSLFNVTATAQCNGGATGECGDVNASLYYNFTGQTPNRLVNTTVGETPFYAYNSTASYRPYAYYINQWFNPTNGYDLLPNDTTTYALSSGINDGDNYLNYSFNLSGITNGSVLFYTWNLTCRSTLNSNFIIIQNSSFSNIAYWVITGTGSLKSLCNQSKNTSSFTINKAIFSDNILFLKFVVDTTANFTVFDTYIPYTTNPQPQSCSQLLQGQNCTATWQVNATGTPGTQYWLNVSFNSESAFINPNSTQNFQVNISSAGPATYAFTITVPGGNYSNSSASMPGGGNPIMNFTYNGTWGGSQSYVNCSFNYSGNTYWQNAATPALKFTNLGSTALTWTIAMNNSLPSWVTLFANDTNAIPSNAFVFSTANSLALSVAASGTKSLWVYANFTSVTQLGGTTNQTQLNHSSS